MPVLIPDLIGNFLDRLIRMLQAEMAAKLALIGSHKGCRRYGLGLVFANFDVGSQVVGPPCRGSPDNASII